MLGVQQLPSVSFAFASNLHQHPSCSSQQSGACWEGPSREGQCSHTPPLLSNTSYKGARFMYGLDTPPHSGQDMNVANGNPLLNPNVAGQTYHRVPVVASNAPPCQNAQTTLDNTKAMGTVRKPFYDSYYSANRPSSPGLPHKDHVTHVERTARRRASSDGNSIASHLQIPSSINDSKGSLPEFAAQITCFFWFESSFTLYAVETSAANPVPTTLVPEASPTTGFRKWVTTILSMTQVSQNVILLALMFIYRLKTLNPGVKGKVGSEFRLLTVALMLGNKFLDDNTYTNKTWAEVSGISVQEIHVMEVEFLSNMRYTLYASEQEWREWHLKLGKFSEYYDKASRNQAGLRNLAIPNPQFHVARDLPSPPASTNTSPPFSVHQPNTGTLPHPLSMPPYLGPKVPSPDANAQPWTRKRSLEDDNLEPAAKRLHSIGASANSSTTLTPSTLNNTPPVPRLPMPNLSISSGQPQYCYNSSPRQLPMSAGRAISTVYPGPNTRSYTKVQLPSLPTTNQVSHAGSVNAATPLERQTRQIAYTTAASTPSPTACHFPQHTPNGLSPSGWPAPRTSPYKPIRSVNTLLVPPPSASIQNHPQNVSYGQMHYQPLGKPVTERKTGVLPYFPFNTWSQPHPMHQMQPYLPQPNFASQSQKP